MSLIVSGLVFAGAAAMLIAAAPAPPQGEEPLALDDVSWLFPAPTVAADRADLISIADVSAPDPANPGQTQAVWSDAAFADFLQIADSAAAQVNGPNGPRIGIPPWARTQSAWFIAGVRIDAGAPGLSPGVMSVFGQRPQIRLILQPVSFASDGTPQAQDMTAHLVFDFVIDQAPPTSCPFYAKPDLAAFKSVVLDAAGLRDQLLGGAFAGIEISTAGLPLGVHPGLANPATEALVLNQMKTLLARHISDARLRTIALMGTPARQTSPWIFVSLLRTADGHFHPVPSPTLDGSQTAMMFDPFGAQPVAPQPHTNNLSPISCASATFPPVLPIANRQGQATADTFGPSFDPSTAANLLSLIADPTRSHFFNTDCVSCHTETRRAMDLVQLANAPGLSPQAMPPGPYTVRNFGWSPSVDGAVHGTATRRTVAETTAVTSWINSNILGQ